MPPLHFLHQSDIAYTFNGKTVRPEQIGTHDTLIDSILLAVPRKNGKLDEQRLGAAKAFAKRYVVDVLHHDLEQDLDDYGAVERPRRRKVETKVEYQDRLFNSPVHTAKLFEKAITAGHILPYYGELYHMLKPNYTSTRAAGYAERRSMVESKVIQWLDAITPERIQADFDKQFSPPANTAKNSKIEDGVTRSLARMPEWMQVLTHEHGAYVVSTTSDPHLIMESWGASLRPRPSILRSASWETSLRDSDDPGIFHIYVNPISPESAYDPILREELVHEMQKHHDRRADMRRTGSNVTVRWQKAAEALISLIDADAHHLALRLIKKTEAHGGSLIVAPLSIESRTRELLVDVFDAEIYLRKKDGKSKEDAQKELIAAFGQEVYDASREYVKLWIDQAAKILEEKIGREKTEQYRQKWLDDPFTHRVTLTELPQYKLGASDLPPH